MAAAQEGTAGGMKAEGRRHRGFETRAELSRSRSGRRVRGAAFPRASRRPPAGHEPEARLPGPSQFNRHQNQPGSRSALRFPGLESSRGSAFTRRPRKFQTLRADPQSRGLWVTRGETRPCRPRVLTYTRGGKGFLHLPQTPTTQTSGHTGPPRRPLRVTPTPPHAPEAERATAQTP